jgi:hypothetical protein
VKTLAHYLGSNFLSTIAGLYLLAQLGLQAKHNPAALFSQDTLDKGASAIVLIAAQDPAKLRALVAKVTSPSVPTNGVDGREPERNS